MNIIKTIIITASLFVICACSNTIKTSVAPITTHETKYETYVSVGQHFPLTQLSSINNQTINLQRQGKRKLVILFATWCSDSQRIIKQLLTTPLVQQENLTIVGIGREENNASLQKFAKDYQVTFPLISDEKRDIYRQFANAGIPRLILVDENNKIVKTLIGEDPATIEKISWTEHST